MFFGKSSISGVVQKGPEDLNWFPSPGPGAFESSELPAVSERRKPSASIPTG
jgi:hypothetical protein